MNSPVRLGILAPTSMVARLAVIPAILASTSCELVAVASGANPGGPPGPEGPVRRHQSYEALLGDDDVEAVYIPLPNSMHQEWVERSAKAGKHVLCEKPLAPDAVSAAAMADACERAGVVLMEAYMSPFHPRSRAVIDLVGSGRLGRLWSGSGVFTGTLSRPEDHRWRPEMGGGALLDVGIYCLAPLLAALVATGGELTAGAAAERTRVLAASAQRAPLGVDAEFEAAVTLGGFVGLARCSFRSVESQRLTLNGSEASVVLDRAFTPSHDDREFKIVAADGTIEIVRTEGGDPYLGMVEHFAEVVRGRAELARTPADSVALAGLLDRLDRASRQHG